MIISLNVQNRNYEHNYFEFYVPHMGDTIILSANSPQVILCFTKMPYQVESAISQSKAPTIEKYKSTNKLNIRNIKNKNHLANKNVD